MFPRADERAWYLRRSGGTWIEIPKPAGGGYSSTSFRKMLAFFLADRPDLLDSLERKALTYKDVEQAIHAYNAGEPTFFIE